ncbi:hypothetical protein BJN44_13945 [Tessaracoccus sp. ZS01]|nr:hypothetical protein BJN44_13945 [Tessaracoccus sp. ZS01]
MAALNRRALIAGTAAGGFALATGCTDEGSPETPPSQSPTSASPTAAPRSPSASASPSPSPEPSSPSPEPSPTPQMAELPGGGTTPFPDRRMVALYGHPTAPVLGMLGEQPPAQAVTRVNALVAEYQQLLPDEKVIGAFEIIVTVASASKTADGSYSNRTPIETIMPWIEAAEANDIYVIIDLQPGRVDFLTQAKLYEELLRRPSVGLALDPEWRLKPNQVHLRQIGQVAIEEVNAVGTWLADLVRDNNLPSKVLVLHQFQPRMVIDRERLDTSRPEIQYLMHADGQGGQPAKQATWQALLKDLPQNVFLGWKNFEDEDLPMLTPQQTVAQVKPLPHLVSYQ